MIKILCQNNIFFIFIDHFIRTEMLKEESINNNHHYEMK